MRLSKRFLQVIAEHIILPKHRVDALSKIDPDHIYIENVRAVLGSNQRIAEIICETAYRRGFFSKSVQFICPDGGGIGKTLPFGSQLPPTVRCEREIDGLIEEVDEPIEHLDRIVFYALRRESASV